MLTGLGETPYFQLVFKTFSSIINSQTFDLATLVGLMQSARCARRPMIYQIEVTGLALERALWLN